MTTYVPFQPNANQPFQFQASFDGQVYSVVIWWSLFGRRWYIWVLTLSGATVAYQAMVGSPDDADNNLIAAYFSASSLVYRATTGNFEITP